MTKLNKIQFLITFEHSTFDHRLKGYFKSRVLRRSYKLRRAHYFEF